MNALNDSDVKEFLLRLGESRAENPPGTRLFAPGDLEPARGGKSSADLWSAVPPTSGRQAPKRRRGGTCPARAGQRPALQQTRGLREPDHGKRVSVAKVEQPLVIGTRLSRGSVATSGLGFTLVELLVVMAIIAILTGLILPALARAKGKSYNAVCLNNLRQLGIATRLYSDDNNNLLPSAEILPTEPIDPKTPLARICDVLASYVGRTAGTNTNTVTVLKCPSDKLGLFAAEGSSYEWNADLNGHRIDETKTSNMFLVWQSSNGPTQTTNYVLRFPPETTPLLLDYEEFHSRAPKSGKNVVYMDGHVAILDVLVD